MTPDPTPDHGAAGFCTDHGHVPGWPVSTVAGSAVYRAVYDTLWRLHGPDSTDEESCAMDAEDVTAAVVAALDDETARGRASADAWWTEYDRELTAHEATKAEVARLTRIVNGYDRTPAEQRAADAEADLDAARAVLDRVRALVDEAIDAVTVHVTPRDVDHRPCETFARARFAADLRAALDPEEPR